MSGSPRTSVLYTVNGNALSAEAPISHSDTYSRRPPNHPPRTSGNRGEHFSEMKSAASTSQPEAPDLPPPAPSGKPTYKRPNGLSVEQQNAVDLLTLGHTDLKV